MVIEVKAYDDAGDSGRYVLRQFCPNCGSSLMADVDAMPGVKVVLAGSLDEPAVFKPTMEIFCASAQPWMTGPRLSARNSTACLDRTEHHGGPLQSWLRPAHASHGCKIRLDVRRNRAPDLRRRDR
jgi:hypothetical protein